ncbi:LysR substrate-binding domain-containing protein [Celeribacter indicus]|nr:LysR substrate-binding domain-containing protein [Celeribacter indicus]
MRNGSFTAAAEELALTQSAVSRQVAGLEELLGVPLLEKNRRRQIVATASGAYYAEQIRQILTHLTAATTEAITLGDRGGVLRLGIPPTFGSLWLIPRMQSFFKTYPNVTVEFSTRLPSRPHASPGELHAVIDFAPAPGSDAVWEELIHLELRAVASEQVAEAIQKGDKGALSGIHLLLHTSERANRSNFFDDLKLEVLRSSPLLTFENYTMLLEAAARGLGVALAPKELLGNDILSKRLVHVTDLSIKSRSISYLVYPEEMQSYPPLVAFRTWLHEIMAADIQAVAEAG